MSDQRREKKRFAFIDHSFHRTTESTLFMIAMLEEQYVVDVFYDDAWQGGDEPDLKAIADEDYAGVFFCQYICDPDALLLFRGKTIVWAPMENGWPRLHTRLGIMLLFLQVKVLCFSKKFYTEACQAGIDAFSVQYAIDPASVPQCVYRDNERPRVFFWYRNNEVTWDVVRRLFSADDIEGIVVREQHDPGVHPLLPTEDDRQRYHIQRTEGWQTRQAYWDALARCSVFVAPRRYEGIGLSVLEALAMGMCVVAPNEPTMNEYITSGVDGILYEYGDPGRITVRSCAEYGRRARSRMQKQFAVLKEAIAACRIFVERITPRRAVTCAELTSLIAHPVEAYLEAASVAREIGEQVVAEEWVLASRRVAERSSWQWVVAVIAAKVCGAAPVTSAERTFESNDGYVQASLLKRFGCLDEARGVFEQVVANTTAPHIVQSGYFHLGEVCFMQQDRQAAARWFERCLIECPSHRKARAYMQQLSLEGTS